MSKVDGYPRLCYSNSTQIDKNITKVSVDFIKEDLHFLFQNLSRQIWLLLHVYDLTIGFQNQF